MTTRLPGGTHSQDPDQAWQIWLGMAEQKLGKVDPIAAPLLKHCFYAGYQSGMSATVLIISQVPSEVERHGILNRLLEQVNKFFREVGA